MTRLSINEINSDQLDELYERLAHIRDAAALHRQGLIRTAELYAAIEADPNPGPPAHDGPSVAECAAADRRWPLEKDGE